MIKNTKILIVDDDRSIGEMLQMLLEMNGYEVIFSQEPGKTEENITAHGTDLVLLDMLISGVNGTDVCARIRSDKNISQVSILMMSALHDAGKRCKTAGANDFIAKPFEMDELLQKINKCTMGIG
ncbi:response regulator [Salinimicrobium sp. TH3]|uniref:response regulator n=1 Tax=Salinimicrobium sp. TH3 TaxID=2997342 RepID=UPI0022746834|nr:response regulator [Salinimicrobium sp. TH3]MCY2687545.1 response regulator [Salinimicrobium sp. TH3]